MNEGLWFFTHKAGDKYIFTLLTYLAKTADITNWKKICKSNESYLIIAAFVILDVCDIC